jgi:hypothetical protein
MNDDPLPWPIPPIWPKDLANVRALLTDEEWADLERRLVHLPDGRLVAWDSVLPTPKRN